MRAILLIGKITIGFLIIVVLIKFGALIVLLTILPSLRIY